ncbi:CASP-like protein 5C1 [Chenopodium quinoa]|uniref:CASP-like protein n=1 Tax=Chenopodium quinoa TaxID=63459 RepID=A0A803KW20_CHEQI|nr:CASP-like protein 5C1 [Chenopodium quinoa]
MVDEVPGSLGTSASLALRLGQIMFSSASLFFMCLDVDFYAYTAFCFLVTVMGLVIPWSMTLGLVDAYSVFIKRPSRQPGVMTVIVVGDWVLSFLSLGAACSSASVAQIMIAESIPACPVKICSRYSLSAAMAFLSCSISFAPSLLNLWILPKL